AWSHRKSPAPSARARRITACDSRESSKSICKEITLQRPKTGKFDYLSGLNHPAHSIAFKFFTDDYFAPPTWTGTVNHTQQRYSPVRSRAVARIVLIVFLIARLGRGVLNQRVA